MDNLKLLYGDSVKVFDELYIKNPKLVEIKNLGFEKYNEYINLLCLMPEDIADILLFDMEIWYEDITSWQLFINSYMTNEKVRLAVEWITGKNFNFVNSVNPYLYYENNDKKIFIDEKIFNYIQKIIKIINFVPDKRHGYNFKNRIAHEMYLNDEYRKRKKIKNRKQKIDLSSIISAVAWKSGVGIDRIWDLSIYQLYEGYFRLNNIQNYSDTMNGIYSGNIDSSKLDLEKINWSNIIMI
jgi:hypothetical protein